MSPVQAPSRSILSQEEIRVFPASVPGFRARERRQHHRFPIRVRSRYLLGSDRGYATTADISSGGVLLQTRETLPVGKPIQVWIDWPALLDQRCPLRLVISGRVLRSTNRGTAVGITRYSFRLRPKSEAPLAA